MEKEPFLKIETPTTEEIAVFEHESGSKVRLLKKTGLLKASRKFSFGWFIEIKGHDSDKWGTIHYFGPRAKKVQYEVFRKVCENLNKVKIKKI